MTERAYRLIVGISILGFLFFELDYAIWALLGLMAIEGLTNWRIPILASKSLYPNEKIEVTDGENPQYKYNYEAERMLRWIIFILVLFGAIQNTTIDLWIFPWFVGIMQILAGVTGICPMVMALRKFGLK